MAIVGLITDIGVLKSQQADNNEGFKVHPTKFAVSPSAGVLNTGRTTENVDVWFRAAISSVVPVDNNTMKFICTIPPGQVPPHTTQQIREVYIEGTDTGNNQFLLALGQPSNPIVYDPEGSVTLELQIALVNVDLTSSFVFDFTQATEVNEHNLDHMAHQDLVQAVNKAGIYYDFGGGPEQFRYRGQAFDENAVPSGTPASRTYSGLTFTSDHNGPNGASITLVFDGIKTSDQVRAVWNNANPFNTVHHNGLGTEVLPTGTISLTGGTLNVVDGDLVYADTDGTYKQALADGSIKQQVAGIMDMTGPIQFMVRSSGFIRRNTGLAVGTSLFLSTVTPGAITAVPGPVKVGVQVYASPDVILIGTGGGGSGGSVSSSGFDAVVTDSVGTGNYTTTQAAINAVPTNSRILVAKLESIHTEILTNNKRLDFFFLGPETGWSNFNGSVETQLIAFSAVPTSGTFRFEWNSQITADLPFNATALQVQNAFNTMSGAGIPVTVTGNFTSGFTITYQPNVSTPLPTFVGAGRDDVQTFTFSSVPDNGTISFSYNGHHSANLSWDDNAATLQTYLLAMGQFTSITVSGNFASGFTVHFTGVDGLQPKLNFTVFANSLMQGVTNVTPTITHTQPGQFPASNLKNGSNPVNITASELTHGLPVGPSTCIQLTEDNCSFNGFGQITGFTTGIDFNDTTGHAVAITFDPSITFPVSAKGVRPNSDYESTSVGVPTFDEPELRILQHPSSGNQVQITPVNFDNIDGSEYTQLLDGQLVEFAGGFIDFNTGTIYDSDNITVISSFTPVALASGQFVYYAVTLVAGSTFSDNTVAGELNVSPGSVASTANAASKTTFQPGLPIGYVLVEGTGSGIHPVLQNAITQFTQSAPIGVAVGQAFPLITSEVPTGDVDGSNQTFILSQAPKTNQSAFVIVNRAPVPNEFWNISGTTLQFTGFTPAMGWSIFVYYVANTSTSQVDITSEVPQPTADPTVYNLAGNPPNQASSILFVDRAFVPPDGWGLIISGGQSSVKFNPGFVPDLGQSVFLLYFRNTTTTNGAMLGGRDTHGSKAEPIQIDPTAGIPVTAAHDQVWFLAPPSGGATPITATYPIAPGRNHGDRATLKGCDGVNYYVLTSGPTLDLTADCNLDNDQSITLTWDDGMHWWSEDCRRS